MRIQRRRPFVQTCRVPLALASRGVLLLLVPLPVLISGCKDKNEIKVYLVSKPLSEETNAPAAGMPPMDGGTEHPSSEAAHPQIIGTPPSNWQPQPTSLMRQASYSVRGTNGTGADISLVILGRSAGDILDNVNRWRSQLGQPAINQEELSAQVKHLSSSLGDVILVDLRGLPRDGDAAKDGRILAGIVAGENGTIFFKMRGNDGLVGSQKAAFLKWIETVRVSPADSASVAPPSVPEKPEISWKVPKGWESLPPVAMRYASFRVAGGDGEQGEISISRFDGDGGGDLPNVNRWRSQIGLEAIGDADLKSLIVPLSCKDGRILTVDMAGSKARVLAGWARIDGKSWFFKLTGPDRLAAAQKPVFSKFLQSVQFHP